MNEETINKANTLEETPTAVEEKKVEKTSKRSSTAFNISMMLIDTALDNAEKPGILHDSIGTYGMTDARLSEGRALLTATRALKLEQMNAQALKIEQTREVERLKAAAQKQYRIDRVMGIELFGDNPHLLEKLGFDSPIVRRFESRFAHAMLLYNNIDTPGVPEAYARYSITPELLTASKQRFIDAKKALAERNRLKALAQKATATKEKSFNQLWAWWLEFRRVVHIALKKDPKLKKQVNINAPSAK